MSQRFRDSIIQKVSIPKRHLIDKHFWYVNAGLLPNYIYEKAVLFIGTYKLKPHELLFVLFLGTKYLIHYIELFTFDNTPLLGETILKHLRYLQSLLGTQRKSKIYLNYRFIIKLQSIFNNLLFMENRNFSCRQIYIDQLEKFCHLFAFRLNIWMKCPGLQAYLYRFGFDPYRSSVIYNSFLIPNQSRYIDPLCRLDQKFIEKIEIKCNCKIMLSAEDIECYLFPEYITLEVIFDLYRGNYLGFMEMFGYIVKQLNPTQYFAKSLRTVIIEGSFLYNILTNIPVRKLKYLEKTVISGCPVTPFLSPDSISKQLISIVANIREQHDEAQNEEISQSDISDEFLQLLEHDPSTQKFYEQNATAAEMKKLKDDVLSLNHSQRLLKYFQWRYDKEMKIINVKKLEEQNIARMQIKNQQTVLMPKTSSIDDVINNIKHEPNITPFYVETMIIKRLSHEAENVNYNSSSDLEKQYSIWKANMSLRGGNNKPISDEKPIEMDQPSQKDINLNSNENNTSTTNEVYTNSNNHNKLSPLDQFRLLLSEPFSDYTNEEDMVNHQIRLMLRCDTEETIHDIKNPYIFQKQSIRDRLDFKRYHYNKLKKRLTKTKSHTSVTTMKYNGMMGNISRSWLSKTASRILSEEIPLPTYESKRPNSSSSTERDILNEKELQEKFPEIFTFFEKYGKKMMDKFIEKKLYQKSDWKYFISKHLNFSLPNDVLRQRVCNFKNVFKNICKKNANRIQKIEDPTAKQIFTVLLLLTDSSITNKEFRQLLNGRGIDAPIIENINKSQSAVPTHIGNIDQYTPNDHLPNLSRCLCQMMYDLVQIANESSPDLFYILKYHISMLDDILKNIKDKNIQSAFQILNIRKELLSLNYKTYVRGYGPNISMIYLAEELSLLHDIIFKHPCCSYKLNKHLGLHVIYHSLKLDDRLNAVEPFFKLPGDRRIRKIENMCNCIIALRAKKHPTITINEYIVDIFYDFDNGNHFGAIDLLKKMMNIVDHRTLVAFPSGELWAFRDTEWLKKCYYISENDIKIATIFKNTDDIQGESSNENGD